MFLDTIEQIKVHPCRTLRMCYLANLHGKKGLFFLVMIVALVIHELLCLIFFFLAPNSNCTSVQFCIRIMHFFVNAVNSQAIASNLAHLVMFVSHHLALHTLYDIS